MSPASVKASTSRCGFMGRRRRPTPVAWSTAFRIALSQGFVPKGPRGVVGLHEEGVELRVVHRGGQLIVQQIAVEEAALVIVLHLL